MFFGAALALTNKLDGVARLETYIHSVYLIYNTRKVAKKKKIFFKEAFKVWVGWEGKNDIGDSLPNSCNSL